MSEDSNTAELMEKVRRIEIRTRKIVENRTGGAYHSTFKGQGIEFSEVREYLEGDDIRAIDWNVSARMGSPYIKLFTEEREQNVFLLVDRSASNDFGSGEQTKTELLAEIAAVLAFSATHNKDRVGLMLYTDKEELHLKPGRGHQHVLRIVRELLAFKTESPKTDLKLGLEQLLANNCRKSVVFILSDLITESEYEQQLRALNILHDVIVIHITDPLEESLPKIPGINIEDKETGVVTRLSRRHAKSLAERAKKSRKEATAICQRSGADIVHLSASEDYLPEMIALFERRSNRRR